MALECVEGADMTGISDERGRRACGAAGFVRVGRLPDPARLLRRDRFSSASRSVQFRIEIGRVPHRDRSGGVTPGCRGHETGISARDRHFRASPTGPSSDSRRNVEFDVPRRCASGDVPPRTQDRAPRSTPAMSHCAVPPRTRDRARSWPPAPSSDSNRNAHVGGASSGRSWRRRRTRSECPRRPDHQCGRDDPAPDRLIARGEGRILMLDRTRPPEHVLTHREHPRPPTACASSTPSGRGLTGRNRSRAGTEPISTRNTTDLGEGTGRGGEGAGTRGDSRGAPRSAAGGLAVRPPAPRRSRRNSRAPLPWEGD